MAKEFFVDHAAEKSARLKEIYAYHRERMKALLSEFYALVPDVAMENDDLLSAVDACAQIFMATDKVAGKSLLAFVLESWGHPRFKEMVVQEFEAMGHRDFLGYLPWLREYRS